MDLVLDLGNYRLKGAFFQEDQVVDSFVLPPEKDLLRKVLIQRKADAILLSSVHSNFEKEICQVLEEMKLPYQTLDFSSVKVQLDVDEPEQVGPDRIANVYGALYHFPHNDCIVVDLGTAVTFDYVVCSGKYLGGAIYPGADLGAKALAEYTDKLPQVEVTKPLFATAKTTKTHIQSGLYWGLLGAIERITFEMRSSSENPSNVKVLATGGLLRTLGPENFAQDLSDLVDLIDPQLTLIGIHEIMKEKK